MGGSGTKKEMTEKGSSTIAKNEKIHDELDNIAHSLCSRDYPLVRREVLLSQYAVSLSSCDNVFLRNVVS